MCLTPDLEVIKHDLNTMRHLVLERNAAFPDAQAGDVYAFDPVARITLELKKRLAALQASVLGEEDPAEMVADIWVIAEASRPKFGEAVTQDLLNDPNTGATFGSKGVVTLDGAEVFVQRILAGSIDEFKKKHLKDDRDVRLLGVHKDKTGKRRLELEDALTIMTEETMPDFPLSPDVRATVEFLTAVSEGPGSLHRYHTEWQRLSGIGDSSAVCHSHRIICEVLRLMHTYDQLNMVWSDAPSEMLEAQISRALT